MDANRLMRFRGQRNRILLKTLFHLCKLINSGRCQYYRSVFIEEVNREELVKLGQIEKGESHNEWKILYKNVALTIIPRARMGSESIAHEADGRMGY